jgi:diguanylate cyclase (GGDEF)-like protein
MDDQMGARRRRIARRLPNLPARGARVWLLVLAAVPVLAAAYLLLPTDGPARLFAYPIFGLIATVAVLVGRRAAAPHDRRAWSFILLALVLLSIGDATYSVLALGSAALPYPSLADVAYLPAYLVLLVGTAGLSRRPGVREGHGPLIDAAILAAGIGAVLWVVLMEPTVRAGTDPLTIGVFLAYPAFDVVLLAVGLRAVLAPACPRHVQLLLAGIAFYFATSVTYSKLLLDGTYLIGQPVDAGWIVGVLLIGVASLHPSVRKPAREAVRETVLATTRVEVRLSRLRLVMLAGAAMLVPALLTATGGSLDQPVVLGLIALWVLIFALVFARLATTVEDLRVSLVERGVLEDDLVHRATHDPLTRLANRALFHERLDAALEADAAGTAVIFIDIDRFKSVNDTMGHAAGDALLQILAARIERGVRPNDLAARMGGDEFAVLVEAPATRAVVRVLTDRILAAIHAPAELSGREIRPQASAGVGFGSIGAASSDLLRTADEGMYEVKRLRKAYAQEHTPTPAHEPRPMPLSQPISWRRPSTAM